MLAVDFVLVACTVLCAFQGSTASAPSFYVAQEQASSLDWVDIYVAPVASNGVVSEMTYVYQSGNDINVGTWFLGTADPTSGEYYITGGDAAVSPYPIWSYSQNGQTTEVLANYPATMEDFHAINSTFILFLCSNYSEKGWVYQLEAFNPQTGEIRLLHQVPLESLTFTQGMTSLDTVSGTLYGIGYREGVTDDYLTQWNMHSGKNSQVAITGPYLMGIAYSADTKTIYGLAASNFGSGDSWIVSIDPSTGVCSNVTSPVPYQPVQNSPLIIDTETLYYLSQNSEGDVVFITGVDPTTKAVSQLKLSGPSLAGLFALQLQPSL